MTEEIRKANIVSASPLKDPTLSRSRSTPSPVTENSGEQAVVVTTDQTRPQIRRLSSKLESISAAETLASDLAARIGRENEAALLVHNLTENHLQLL